MRWRVAKKVFAASAGTHRRLTRKRAAQQFAKRINRLAMASLERMRERYDFSRAKRSPYAERLR